MCIHPLLTCERGLGKIVAEPGRTKKECAYVVQGCEKSKDKETYERFCSYDGRLCKEKFRREMEK